MSKPKNEIDLIPLDDLIQDMEDLLKFCIPGATSESYFRKNFSILEYLKRYKELKTEKGVENEVRS